MIKICLCISRDCTEGPDRNRGGYNISRGRHDRNKRQIQDHEAATGPREGRP